MLRQRSLFTAPVLAAHWSGANSFAPALSHRPFASGSFNQNQFIKEAEEYATEESSKLKLALTFACQALSAKDQLLGEKDQLLGEKDQRLREMVSEKDQRLREMAS